MTSVPTLVACTIIALGQVSQGQTVSDVFQPVPTLDSIGPGTRVGRAAVVGWSQVVLVSQPTISETERDKLFTATANLAVKFGTVTAIKTEFSTTANRYHITSIGHGIITRIGQDLVVVTVESERRLGVGLSLPARMLLGELEAQQRSIRIAGAWSEDVLVDTPAIMPRDNNHVAAVIRYLYRLNPRTGHVRTYVARVDGLERGAARLTSRIATWDVTCVSTVPLLVDEREIHWGIPSPSAFAIGRIPTGQVVADLPPADGLLFAQSRFDSDDFARLARAFPGFGGNPDRP